MQRLMKIHEMDNVAVALTKLMKGEIVLVEDVSILLQEDIPQGHKFALRSIHRGEQVMKYGAPIGHATDDITAGSWVHTHNIKTNLGDNVVYTYQKVDKDQQERSDYKEKTESVCSQYDKKPRCFEGFLRENGKAGIRNDIFIIPTVGCVSKVAVRLEQIGAGIVEAMKNQLNSDNQDMRVMAFEHPYGCSQMGDDQEHTREILSDLIEHPNAGGVLVLGLGCENSNITELKKYLKDKPSNRIRFLVCQEVEDEIEEGKKLLTELIQGANFFTREKLPLSKLIVGVKCGGSDGLSGITANPTVGLFSDLLIQQGGTTILTEVPEMFGAETSLMNRCVSKEIFDKTVNMIDDFKDYYRRNNQVIYENPSPGNKAGGISTLEDKSLGCTQKSGSAEVVDVLAYGARVCKKGLNLLSAPGNDLIASTALAASGAQLVLFTTGRGTPFAAPVPTLKISTNSGLAELKQNWVDFNCGLAVEDKSCRELASLLLEEVICVASGRRVKSEKAGYHDMAIFKTGVTL